MENSYDKNHKNKAKLRNWISLYCLNTDGQTMLSEELNQNKLNSFHGYTVYFNSPPK